MLEPPDLSEHAIAASLQQDFGIEVATVDFLPLGVDTHAAVYRVTTHDDGRDYFLKLRTGEFNETAVQLTSFLSQQGVPSIIAPRPTQTGRLWGSVGDYRTLLYPFVAGRDGYEAALSDHHWVELGRALRQIHDTPLPAELSSAITVETFAPSYRDRVRRYLSETIEEVFADPVSAEMAVFLRARRDQVLALVDHAESLGTALSQQRPTLVVCHSDLHAGNVLIGDDDRLTIVDWDEPARAPRECDLMYPGGAQGFTGHTPQQEVTLFFQGYNEDRDPVQPNPAAIAYYRCERIIKDVAEYCREIFLSDENDEDRAQGLQYLKSNFRTGGTIEAAYRRLSG